VRNHFAHVLGALTLLMFGGCTTLPNGHDWGEDVSFRPGWHRFYEAASAAATSPDVWAPLAGVAAFRIDRWDRKTSDWARDKTPIFGSQERAAKWSNDLRLMSSLAFHISTLATPSGESPEWLESKAKGYAVELAAVAATSVTTRELKTAVGRERPDGSDHESFPSGHTSRSAVETQLAKSNLRSIDLNDDTRRLLDVGLDSLTIGTAWARVEAGAHFPSDTLFSMAIGNFMAILFTDAFLGLDGQSPTTLSLGPLPNGHVALLLEVHF
jgi:membrane-associated phospholipid phosphatase